MAGIVATRIRTVAARLRRRRCEALLGCTGVNWKTLRRHRHVRRDEPNRTGLVGGGGSDSVRQRWGPPSGAFLRTQLAQLERSFGLPRKSYSVEFNASRSLELASDCRGGYQWRGFFLSTGTEGSKITTGSRRPNTRSATLDSLAFEDKLFGEGNVVIDVLKVDAENVDALVLVGATRLLKEGRVRVVMWETPNSFPIQFPVRNARTDDATTTLPDFVALVDFMDSVMDMACYFPGRHGRYFRLTRCGVAELLEQVTCPCTYSKRGKCRLAHSNAFCVHRQAGSAVYNAIEKGLLVADFNATGRSYNTGYFH
ncbi:hypothetical protein ACHAWF_010433 [Thalassiosira exigua]